MPVVGNDPRNGSWESEFEKNGGFRLPDCRVSYLERDKHRIRMGYIGMAWDIVYCAQCHQPSAATSPDCPHVFFICQGCYDKMLPDNILEDLRVPGT